MSLTASSPLPSPGRADAWAASSAQAQARNPVALRLYKVLGAKYDDDATRAALHTLSDFYAPPPSVAATTCDLSKDEWDESDSEDEAHASPSPAFLRAAARPAGDIASRARTHMRRDVERRLAEGSRRFLSAFGDVDGRLDELQAHIGAMQATCADADAQLARTNDACAELLERAGSLRAQRADVQQKQTIVTLFLARFTLSEAETAALTSRDVPVGSRFFNAMDKAARIRADCRVLMAGEDGPTQAGLDIMATTAGLLEQGYDKMAREAEAAFRAMGRDSMHADVPPALRESMRRLHERPELLSDALALLAQTRAGALAAAFTAALTRGGPGGLPRPIELHAHDPLRYAGDMLAWVHQALAGERELAEALLGSPGRRMVGADRGAAAGAGEPEMRALVDGAVGRLCAPLKARVQQTVRAQESSIASYKLANLLQFYALTMRRTLGEDAVLSVTLDELTDAAYRVFFDSIEAQGRALLRMTLDVNDPDLNPPALLADHLHVLREILGVHASTLADGAPAAEEAAAFARVLAAGVDPALEACAAAAAQKARAAPGWDARVFRLNCLAAVGAVLGEHEFAGEKSREVEEKVEEQVKELIEEHYVDLLHDAGLAEPVAVVDSKPSEPLARLPPTSASALSAALAVFAGWLSSPAVLAAPRLAALRGHGLPARVHRAALARLARAYARLCAAVKDPRAGYEAGATLLGGAQPFGQVAMVWQIFGIEEGEDEEGEGEDGKGA